MKGGGAAATRLGRSVSCLLSFVLIAMLLPTQPALATFPGDNGRFAFYGDRAGDGYDIWTMEFDGSGSENLTDTPGVDEFSPAWDPTGAKVVFHRVGSNGMSDVFVMPADGSGPAVNITKSPDVDDSFAQFCDQDSIVYNSDASGNYDIFERAADGSGQPTQLTTSPASDFLPTCSPDGTTIAWRNDAGGSQIWHMDRDGANKEVLVSEGGSDPDYSPDASQLAFTSVRDGNSELFVMDLGSGQQRKLTNTTGVANETPRWFPDGSFISFTRFGSAQQLAQQDPCEREGWVIDPEFGEEFPVTPDDCNAGGLTTQPIGLEPPPEEVLVSIPRSNVPTEPMQNPPAPCKGVLDWGVFNVGEPDVCPIPSYHLVIPDPWSDAGPDPVYLHSGEFYTAEIDLEIPGRGFNWRFQRKYRSGITYDGPLGFNWEFNYNARLIVATPENLTSVRESFPDAEPGDVVRMDGNTRADLYPLGPDGKYTAPEGFYMRLDRKRNGSFVERTAHGTSVKYAAPAEGTGLALMTALVDRNNNVMRFEHDPQGRLIRVLDTLGRPILYRYGPTGRLAEIEDFIGRRVRFEYDSNGNLVSVTGPSVTGTPNGNDFPNGKTTRYTYSSDFPNETRNHNLLTITAPNEVASGGPPRIQITYDSEDRVTELEAGGTNDSGVPAGGSITYDYETLSAPDPDDPTTAANRTTVTDRNGNETVYEFNSAGNIVLVRELTNRDVRPGDPAAYEQTFDYNLDSERIEQSHPEGNEGRATYDDGDPDRLKQGNLLQTVVLADPDRGGDQDSLTTTNTFEPIYNQLRSETDPRGNDPDYEPQNGGANSPGRYTTTYTFDYQEGTRFKALARRIGRTPGQVKKQLSQAGIPMGLGDVNGDGTTKQVNGNIIRIEHPKVRLMRPCKSRFAIPKTKPNCSLQARREGTRTQRIVELFAYNRFGQIVAATDPEGNVSVTKYYPGNDPDGDGQDLIPGATTRRVGYPREKMRDARPGTLRNSRTNPAPAKIRNLFFYDPVGNMIRKVDGRGIATDFILNELNQRVEVVRAAAHGIFTPSPREPEPLTDFAYIRRTFYDANNNVVREQVEDRGDTSGVGGDNGATAFVDTVSVHDINDKLVEISREVSDTEDLVTRFRYDPNENLVLRIYPEGNADSLVFDERDMLFQETRGVHLEPALALLAPGDPTNYDVRGGIPSIHSYRYDANGNLVEESDAADTDGSTANNATFADGDRIRYLYDGFDRPTSVIDAVGSQKVMQYDPASSVVRELAFGPSDGPSPIADGPDQLGGPVSTDGVINPAGLVNTNLLVAAEFKFDELGRQFESGKALFVNTITTSRSPDVADGALDVGKGNLTPGDTCEVPGAPAPPSGYEGCVTDRTEYDRNSRATVDIEDDGDIWQAFYDGVGRRVQTRDPEGNVTKAAYDDNDNLIELRELDRAQIKGVKPEIFLTTRFFDSLNRLERSVDNLGQTTDYRYDSRGNLVAQADANGPSSGQSISRRKFKPGSLTVNQINDFGNVTRFRYDGLSRALLHEVVLTQNGSGDGEHIGANIFGVRSAPPQPDPNQGGGDGLIRTGNLWDGNSELIGRIDDDGNVSLYLYDDLGRRVTETKGLTTSTAPLTKNLILGPRRVITPTVATENDPAAIPAGLVDDQLQKAGTRLGQVTSAFPALADRIDDDPPTTIVYGWDEDDNLLILEDENDSEAFHKFDAIDRLLSERVFRAGQSDSHLGDPNYAPAPVQDPANPSSAFDPVIGTTKTNFEYDGISRLVLATDNNDPGNPGDDSSVTLAWDSLSRAIEESQHTPDSGTRLVSFGFRANLRSELTYPNGRVVAARHDGLDRVATISDTPSDPIAEYDYIGQGRVLERRYPGNGTRMTMLDGSGKVDVGYDGVRRPIRIRHLRASRSLVVGFDFSYDRDDQKTEEIKLHDPKNSEAFTYDSANRLIALERTDPAASEPLHESWELDGVGNWASVDGEQRQHSSFNELIARAGESLDYDDDGNTISDGEVRYRWDYRNRLRRVVSSTGTTIATYSYDALNRRISKSLGAEGDPGATTHFSYDTWRVIEERDGQGGLLRQYVYGEDGLDELLVMDVNQDGDDDADEPTDRRLYYHENDVNSVHGLTDASGALVEAYHYDAYGRPTVFSPGPNGQVDFGGDDGVAVGGDSVVGNPHLFTGQRLDPETGHYYYRTRYLDPMLGRFMSRDHIGVWGDPFNYGNGYAYVGNSPPTRTDPMGMGTFIPDWLGVEVAVGGVVRGEACIDFCTGEITGTVKAEYTFVAKLGKYWWSNYPVSVGGKGSVTLAEGSLGPFDFLDWFDCGECDPCCVQLSSTDGLFGQITGKGGPVEVSVRVERKGQCRAEVVGRIDVNFLKLFGGPGVAAFLEWAEKGDVSISAGFGAAIKIGICGDRAGNVVFPSAQVCGSVFGKIGFGTDNVVF